MSKRRVLVVDDDVNLSRLSGMILENSGKYEMMIVNHSARALTAAIQFQAKETSGRPIEGGGMRFLSKPVDSAQLLAAIAALLSPALLRSSKSQLRHLPRSSRPANDTPVDSRKNCGRIALFPKRKTHR
jgi:DNA-binding NtrC family response regulator